MAGRREMHRTAVIAQNYQGAAENAQSQGRMPEKTGPISAALGTIQKQEVQLDRWCRVTLR